MELFIVNIPALICFAIAAILIWFGKEHWGWFIGAGFVLLHIIKIEK